MCVPSISHMYTLIEDFVNAFNLTMKSKFGINDHFAHTLAWHTYYFTHIIIYLKQMTHKKFNKLVCNVCHLAVMVICVAAQRLCQL